MVVHGEISDADTVTSGNESAAPITKEAGGGAVRRDLGVFENRKCLTSAGIRMPAQLVLP